MNTFGLRTYADKLKAAQAIGLVKKTERPSLKRLNALIHNHNMTDADYQKICEFFGCAKLIKIEEEQDEYGAMLAEIFR